MSDLAFQIMSQIMDSEPQDPEDYAMIAGHFVSNDFYQRVEELANYLASVQAKKLGLEVCHEF